MKRFLTLLIIIIVPALTLYAQDCYRFNYLQMQKKNLADKKYLVNEMKLDFDGKSSFYYCETSFKRDSLSAIAFNKNGEIVNEKAYAERTRLSSSATNDKTIIDFSKGEMSQLYHEVAFFDGSMPLELPQWIITDKEEEQSGYTCKVATGSYLGREWTIWFTEEIPANVGPWLFWGTPGLVVYAVDSENVFNFRLLGVEIIKESRKASDLSYLESEKNKQRAKVFSMQMKEMETIHTKYMRDVAYFNRIHGITGGYVEDRNGNRTEIQMTRPYIPYIADGYWKSK